VDFTSSNLSYSEVTLDKGIPFFRKYRSSDFRGFSLALTLLNIRFLVSDGLISFLLRSLLLLLSYLSLGFHLSTALISSSVV